MAGDPALLRTMIATGLAARVIVVAAIAAESPAVQPVKAVHQGLCISLASRICDRPRALR